jgi:hypothetical protein
VRDFIDAVFLRVAAGTQAISSGVRRIYSGYVGDYAMYIVFFLAALIFVEIVWRPW